MSREISIKNFNECLIIKEGSVDVFLSKFKGGKPYGNRKYLFTSKDLVIGTEFKNIYGFIILLSNNAFIEKIDIKELLKNIKQHKKAIERYIIDISEFKLSDKKVELIENETAKLRKGEIFSIKNNLAWIEVIIGSTNVSSLLGKLYPLSSKSTDISKELSEISIHDTDYIIKNGYFENSFLCFYNFIVANWINDFEIRDKMIKKSFMLKIEFAKQSMNEAIKSILSIFYKSKFENKKSDKNLNLEAIRRLCIYEKIQIVESDKSNVTLEEIANDSNFTLRSVNLENGIGGSTSLIAYLKSKNRLLTVAILAKGNRYLIYNPYENEEKYLNSEMFHNLHKEAYQLYKPIPIKRLSILSFLKFGLNKNSFKDLDIIFLSSFAIGILSSIAPVVTGMIFKNLIIPNNYFNIFLILITSSLIGVISILFDLSKSISMIRIEGILKLNIESSLWKKIFSLPLNFIKKFTSIDLIMKIRRISNMIDTLPTTLFSLFISLIFSILQIIILFYYNRQLASLFILLSVFPSIINLITLKINLNIFNKLNSLKSKVISISYQIINGIIKFRVTGGESRAFAIWAKNLSDKENANYKLASTSNYISLVNDISSLLLNTFLFYAYYFIYKNNKAINIGEFLAFQMAFSNLIISLNSIVKNSYSILNSITYYKNIIPILTEPYEVYKDKIKLNSLEGNIELQNVNFKYEGSDNFTLNDISLKINKGEYIAIVGPSGSGKSTLIKLLLGFEKPLSGTIYYDDININNINTKNLRRKIGTVLQNNSLIPGDIYSNIIGPFNLSINRAWKAAHLACLDKDIEDMPMGMSTMISEGISNISGGQKQRIFIARALVNNPKVLYLDEATSSLDNKSQAIVTKVFNSLKITKIVIAHRLSTIIKADRIYVLNNGKIIEEGSYKELVDKKQFFYYLMKKQTN